MFRVYFAAGVLAAAGAACQGPSGMSLLGPGGPIAVGGTSFPTIVSTSCGPTILGKQDCDNYEVTFLEVSVDDPALFDVTFDPDRPTLTALKAGKTTLRIVAEDPSGQETFEKDLEALEPDRVEVDPGCEGPLLFPTGTTVRFAVTLFAGETQLLGLPPDTLFCDVAQTSGKEPTFELSATPATGTLTSRFDPSLELPVRVFAVDEVTLEAPDPTSEYGTNTASFVGMIRLDGERPCVDELVRHFEIATPSVCGFGSPGLYGETVWSSEMDVAGPNRAVARRRSAGTCTVQVSLADRPGEVVEKSYDF